MVKELNHRQQYTFCKKQQAIWIGLGICLFVACLSIAMWLTIDTPDKNLLDDLSMRGGRRGDLRLIVAGMPLFFFVIGIRKTLSGISHRLRFCGNEVIVQSILGGRRFCFNEVISLDWKQRGTILAIKFRGGTLKIRRYDYSIDDFNKISNLFRTGVPEDRQKSLGS